jgi:antitoxin MazE
MRASIIPIGNSKGLRLPKAVIEQYDLRDEVELEFRGDELVITSVHKPRKGWESSFQNMSRNKDDGLMDPQTPAMWDKTEWEW